MRFLSVIIILSVVVLSSGASAQNWGVPFCAASNAVSAEIWDAIERGREGTFMMDTGDPVSRCSIARHIEPFHFGKRCTGCDYESGYVQSILWEYAGRTSRIYEEWITPDILGPHLATGGVALVQMYSHLDYVSTRYVLVTGIREVCAGVGKHCSEHAKMALVRYQDPIRGKEIETPLGALMLGGMLETVLVDAPADAHGH